MNRERLQAHRAGHPVGSLSDKLHVLDLRQQALAGLVEDVFHRRQRPSREYLRFRLLTQYGDSDARARGADVVNYLAWCRTQP